VVSDTDISPMKFVMGEVTMTVTVCKFEFLGTRNPEKVLLLVILSLFVCEICQNVYFDGSHLQTSNRATPCQCYVIHISELDSLVPKTPEK